jgi:membrane-associated protease RseP (regulator of RpoE activity)
MRHHGFPWPAAVVLALGLGILTPIAVPRALAADEEDQGTQQKRVIRIITKGDKEDSDESAMGYLGVQVQDMTRSLQRAMDLQGVEGALVNRVEDGGPADEAGIQKGDVIVQMNRKDTPGAEELTSAVRDLKPGTKTSIVVVRDGSRKTLTVVVGSRPKSDEAEIEIPDMGDDGGQSVVIPPGMRDNLLKYREQMLQNRGDMQRQMADLKTEISRLADEIRELRKELARRPVQGR